MGAKHSCCAYSSPRTDRSKKDKSRRETSRESDRYEPSQISNINHKVSESVGNLQHIRQISLSYQIILLIIDYQRERAWWLGGWSESSSHSDYDVHGEIQVCYSEWSQQKKVTNAPSWLPIYWGFHHIEESLELLNNIHRWLYSVPAQPKEHNQVCFPGDILSH